MVVYFSFVQSTILIITSAIPSKMDERLDIETIFNSWTGISITVVLSFASTMSSALVIYLILHSEKKLSQSVLHHIFLGISVADIMHYLSVVTTTLPMPTDMIYTGYQGLMIGNDLTCSIQGTLVSFGLFAGFLYNAMLSVYYLCSIKYDISDETFSRRFEPILHIICICTSLVPSISGNFGVGYHPNPTSFSWCGFTKYPYWCEGDTCIHIGHSTITQICVLFGSLISVLSMIVIIFSMISITYKVHKQEQNIARIINLDRTHNASRRQSILIRSNALNEKKVIFGQAIAYSIVSFLAFSMAILPQIIRMSIKKQNLPGWWQISYLFLRPLQGSLNSAVFIYHKVHSLQREDDGISFCMALKMALTGMEGAERLIADITPVRRQEALDRLPIFRDASFSSGESSPVDVEGGDASQGNHATTPAKELAQASSSEEAPLSVARTPNLDPSFADESQDLSGFSGTKTTTSLSFGGVAEGGEDTLPWSRQ